MLGSGSELGGVRVWRAGPFFKHTLELRFKTANNYDFYIRLNLSEGKIFKFVDNPFKV